MLIAPINKINGAFRFAFDKLLNDSVLRIPDLFGSAHLEDLSLMEHGNAVGNTKNTLHIMSNHNGSNKQFLA